MGEGKPLPEAKLMKENNLEYNDGMEIDVQRLVNALLKKEGWR